MKQFPQYADRPPVPVDQYELVHAAEARQHRKPPTRAILFALAVALVITAIAGWLVMTDSPARGAADRAAVVSPTSAAPAIRNKPVEKAPPVPEVMPKDGMYAVGREIKPGVYRTDAEDACWWARLRDLRREQSSMITAGYVGVGVQYVEILKTDKAFATAGCGRWVKVR